MRHPRRAPVSDFQVEARELRKPHDARLPMRRLIRIGAVIAVADIAQCDLVAFFRPRLLRHVELPCAAIAGFQCEPSMRPRARSSKT
jgi:hypothetical protein